MAAKKKARKTATRKTTVKKSGSTRRASGADGTSDGVLPVRTPTGLKRTKSGVYDGDVLLVKNDPKGKCLSAKEIAKFIEKYCSAHGSGFIILNAPFKLKPIVKAC